MMKTFTFRYTIIFFTICLISALIIFIFRCTSKDNNNTEGKIQINGIEIYYKMMGTGTPTFILHGGPGDSYETMLQLKNLADQFKLIFYDQRAAGRSTGDEDTASHTVEQFVEDLEQLRLKLAPGKINIIAGSWGALVAMQYAFKYSKNIDNLVLMSSMGVSSEYFKYYRANIEANRTKEDSITLEMITNTDEFKKGIPEVREKFWRIFFKAYFYNPELVDSINLKMRDTTYAPVPDKYARIREFFRDYDISNDLKKISCPTLILYGDHDPTPIDYIKPIHEKIKGSQLIIFENAGHWLWVEIPDKIISVIRNFLKSN